MTNTRSPTLSWRQIQLPSDLPGLVHVGEIIHPSLPESPAVFTERATLFPEGCLVLADSDPDLEAEKPGQSSDRSSETASRSVRASRICGYAISYPIEYNQPPELDSLLGSVPGASSLSPVRTQYYIHDIAILPDFQGQGFADQCIRLLLDVAKRHGYKTTVLISVYGTSTFWGRYGFVPPEDISDALKEKVKGYGDDAVYLARTESEPEAKGSGGIS